MPEPRARILFVEDDMGKRYVIARQLRLAGFEVEEAETGESGLAKARPDHDVMILDLRLPDLHGWEVCRRIKNHPDLHGMMVLELSATLSTAQDRAKGLEMGADAYLVHPVELVELIASIDALVRLRRAVQERDLQRELFVATVSHDLRNPLAAVVTGLEVLKLSPKLGDKELGVITKVDRSVARMRRLIDQLLVFTQGIAGTMAIDPAPTTLGAIARTTLGEIAPTRPVNVQADSDPPLMGDPSRLSQLIENLVTNALKHGSGDVTVRIRPDGDDVTLGVHNMGTPIPPDAIPTLFQPYRRATPRAGGFGLGLFIVDRIARAHGGSVTVTSSETEGTTFLVRLPIARA